MYNVLICQSNVQKKLEFLHECIFEIYISVVLIETSASAISEKDKRIDISYR